VGLLLVLLAGCGAPSSSRSAEAKTQAGAPTPLRVVVQKPRRVVGSQQLELPGSLEPFEKAAIYARVTGYLESVAVDIGDPVEEGTELARLVVPEMAAELRRAAARVAQQRAQLDLAKITQERLARLRSQSPDAVSQQAVDEAEARRRIQEADLQEARAELDRLRALSALARLRAPFRGRITRRVLDPGALVRKGTSSGARPVVEIARTDPIRLVFEVPERVVSQVKKGLALAIHLDALPALKLEGVVSRVAGALDPRTRSMRAEAELSNAQGQLQPGMYASVQLSVPLPQGLSLPSRSIRGSGAERYVLVAQGGVLERRPVRVASDDGRLATLIGGVSPTDLVMVSGSPLAREGARCEAVPAESP